MTQYLVAIPIERGSLTSEQTSALGEHLAESDPRGEGGHQAWTPSHTTGWDTIKLVVDETSAEGAKTKGIKILRSALVGLHQNVENTRVDQQGVTAAPWPS
ncbi:hypothetical protein ACIBCC_07635 [Streptomyces griseus]|uniref:hypothetical protein n=1 Tax=Streptomyces griseus TaxID=1911 RepID=UPI0037B8A339